MCLPSVACSEGAVIIMEKVLDEELCIVVHIEGDSPRSYLYRKFRPDIALGEGFRRCNRALCTARIEGDSPRSFYIKSSDLILFLQLALPCEKFLMPLFQLILPSVCSS